MGQIDFSISRRGWILLRWGRELKRRHQARQIWRGKDEHPADMATITSFFEHSTAANELEIDAQTWDDLELEDLFARLNRTVSLPGAQVLYAHLRGGQFPLPQFDALHALIQELRKNRRLREQLQIALLPLRHVQGDLARVLAGAWDPPPRYARWLSLYPYCLVAMITVAFFVPAIWLGVMAMLLLSWVLHLRLFVPMAAKMPECTYLIRLLAVVQRLGKWRKTPIDSYLQPCQLHRAMAKRVVRRLLWFYIDPSQFGEIFEYVIRFLQIYLLKDVIAYHRLLRYAVQYVSSWQSLFEAIGFLDAAMAMTAFVDENPGITRVQWAQGAVLEAEGLYHPLIDQAVANDLHLDGRSLLITGSNMSGKTTFIKTVGVNLWLARTLGLVCAKRLLVAPFRIFSSINRLEGLEAGKSYYYREIERILEFINLPNDQGGCLILIDEIFRGTNTAERVAASTVVLKELTRKGVVMVATHDVELEDRLEGPFRMVHFREEVQNGIHFFDYRIHDGPCRSRNAIRLLELVGYPDYLIRSALAELR